MSISKDEKERQYYNKKLIKAGFQDEIKKPHKIDWADFVTTFLGIFIGLSINRLTGIETRISNGVLCFLSEILIMAGCLFAVKLAATALRLCFGGKT